MTQRTIKFRAWDRKEQKMWQVFGMSNLSKENTEIIGNIYQNPELLKQKI